MPDDTIILGPPACGKGGTVSPSELSSAHLEAGDAGWPLKLCGKQSHSPRAARHPPVRKPEMMAFQGSSFCLYPFTAQSNVLRLCKCAFR